MRSADDIVPGGPDAAEPRFVQIADLLASELAGTAEGVRLPSERMLCERFQASRVTLRRALTLLAERGVLTASWGRGWFVTGTEPLSEPPNALVGFTELGQAHGHSVSSKVLALETEPATIDDATPLRLPPGSPLLRVDRIRYLDDIPTVWQRSLLALAYLEGLPVDAPTLDLEHRSLYAEVEAHCGVIGVRADYLVEARAASAEEADWLAVPVGSPVLQTAQVTFDQHDVAFERHWSVYPQGRYRFQATLYRPGAPRSSPSRSPAQAATASRTPSLPR